MVTFFEQLSSNGGSSPRSSDGLDSLEGFESNNNNNENTKKLQAQNDRGGVMVGAHVTAAQQKPKRKKNSSANAAEEEEIVQPKGFLGKQRYLVGKFVNDGRIQAIILLMIGINAILMALATFQTIKQNASAVDAFEIIDLIFLIIFTVESAMQLFYHGPRLFLNGWLTFDLIIVALSWAFAKFQVIRSFRVFRALRLITRIQALKVLVEALLAVIPRIGAISFLLILIFYIFAVMFTSLFKETSQQHMDPDYFGRLDKSLFSLFQFLTMDWADAARQTMAFHPAAWIPFVIFVCISGFVVFNLIVGVLCEALAVLSENNDDIQDEYSENGTTLTGHHKERLDALSSSVATVIQRQDEIQNLLESLSNELMQG
eukprot:CAMPEP_0184862664 /NCGR_PEP_ID=MMETSP0580-20130426/7087_1 /TAXON_ID=1118495 /ORGANISM="Dactyliosolen fragilissimus" /LENGTH=372 /DNA_ID=CAMNT_0027360617 /DNA_START=254 /DNA_END=1372 /DNA_ORIENTATION=+